MSYNHKTVENTVCYNTNLHIKKNTEQEIRDTGTEIRWGWNNYISFVKVQLHWDCIEIIWTLSICLYHINRI